MRYGLLSDVHGNLPALEAALDVLSSEGVDSYLCAGDLVGYGPYPNECVERVLALPGVTVAGNHDLIALGALPAARGSAVALESLRWTARVLTPRTRELLTELPRHAETPDGVVLAHGSLGDPQEYVATPARAAAEVQRARREHPGMQVLVVGHTHHALAVDDRGACRLADGVGPVGLAPGRAHLVNPGAVGQSRERSVRVRVAVLDVEAGVATFHAVAYDHAEVRAALRRHGLSQHGIHSPPPSAWQAAAARLRRKVRRRARRAD